jgi:Ni/Co efflux regulator RcnB
MLKMKKIIAILLAVCFLVSITAASASAGSPEQLKSPQKHDERHKSPQKYDERHKKFEHHKKYDKPEVTKEVIKTLKKVRVNNGVWKLQLIKYTKKTHHHKEVWFEKKWKFVSYYD